MIPEDDYLKLSGIQHFLFCRRQWALIHIEGVWQDNSLTAEGHIVHERVHDTKLSEIRNGLLTIRGMSVKSEKLGISGQCDAVEFYKDSNGIKLNGHEGLWSLMPVEYKHGSAKKGDYDRAQLALQAICLEEMFCIPVTKGYLFYNETRRRECVEIDSELRSTVLDAVKEMRDYFSKGHTPNVKVSKKCSNCSLYNLCLPEITDKGESVDQYIRKYINEI